MPAKKFETRSPTHFIPVVIRYEGLSVAIVRVKEGATDACR